MNLIKLEILESSYQEHFKYAKDISMFLPLNHPKRKKLEAEMASMITEINKMKNELYDKR